MNINYIISKVTDRDGNDKIIPPHWYKNYEIRSLQIGGCAFLDAQDGSKNFLRTSTVQDVSIKDNIIKIETLNTIYYLTPVDIYA